MTTRACDGESHTRRKLASTVGCRARGDAAERGQPMLLGDIIALNAGKTPDGVALIDGDREITFAHLHERATRLANAMLQLASPGDRIAILAQNVVEYVECYYGVPAAGMALTFLNYRLHPKEWAWILANAEASVLIVEPSFLDQIRPLLRRGPVAPARDRAPWLGRRRHGRLRRPRRRGVRLRATGRGRRATTRPG